MCRSRSSQSCTYLPLIHERIPRKAGSTAWTRNKLRIRRPAPARSTTAKAYSPTTITLCQRRTEALPVKARPASLSDPCGDVLRAFKAGAIPNSIPVSRESPRANASTSRLIATWSSRGISGGASRIKELIPTDASPTPRVPEARKSRTVSVRSCPAFFFFLLHTTKGPERGIAGFFRLHPRRDVFLRLQLHVELQFLVQIALQLAASNDCCNPA